MHMKQHFINNRWTAPAAGGTIPVIDPSDGGIFAYLARGNGADIEAAVNAARAAYEGKAAYVVLAGAATAILMAKVDRKSVV